MKIANRSFENATQLKYFGTTVTNQHSIQEEIRRKLNAGNACYRSVQNLSCSRLLSEKVKIKDMQVIMLPTVLYGREAWSLTFREEHRPRVFENRVLRRIFGTMEDEVTRDWRTLSNEELHNLHSSPSILRMTNRMR
jgi:hypothetical protein